AASHTWTPAPHRRLRLPPRHPLRPRAPGPLSAREHREARAAPGLMERDSHSRRRGGLRLPRNRYARRSGARETHVPGGEGIMTKFVFVTGGVVSSLGKGIAASSIGSLLKSRGLEVTFQKFSPYLNVGRGRSSPYQPGEVVGTDADAPAATASAH